MLLEVDVPVAPVGSVHAYEVAPDTGATEYVTHVLRHPPAGPEMAPGLAG